MPSQTSAPPRTDLQNLIEAQLKLVGLSARAASLKAGLGKEFIGNLLSGKKESFQSRNLRQLADVLQIPPELLYPHAIGVNKSTNSTERDLLPIAFRRIVSIVGDLQKAVWHQPGRDGKIMQGMREVTSRDEKYAELEQFARHLKDNAIDQFYPAGSILIYADHKAVGIRPGSLLVVQRERLNGDVEVAAWLAVLRNGKLHLSTASTGPARQEIVSAQPGGEYVKVEILGVVISGMLPAPGLSGPMIPDI